MLGWVELWLSWGFDNLQSYNNPCKSMQVSKYANLVVCKYTNLQVFEYLSMNSLEICKYSSRKVWPYSPHMQKLAPLHPYIVSLAIFIIYFHGLDKILSTILLQTCFPSYSSIKKDKSFQIPQENWYFQYFSNLQFS